LKKTLWFDYFFRIGCIGPHLPANRKQKPQTSTLYFPAGTAPASFVVQNPVSGVEKEQTHALVGQGWVRLHLPLQVLV